MYDDHSRLAPAVYAVIASDTTYTDRYLLYYSTTCCNAISELGLYSL